MDINRLVQIVETEVKKALAERLSAGSEPATLGTEPSRAKRVLALFTGGHEKIPEALSQIERLIQEGYNVDIVLSESAVKVITPERVRGVPHIGEVICEPEGLVSSAELVSRSDAVIVPVLTRNSAAKVALGIADTLATNIIMHALITGKLVVVARNSADPDTSDSVFIATYNTPVELRDLARNYLQKLERYGVKLVDVSEIAHVVINGGIKGNSPKERALVTQDTIVKLPDGTKQIKLTRGSIVTPLARDVARERGIEIVFSDD